MSNIYLLNIEFVVTKNKRQSKVNREMVAKEIAVNIFDKKDIVDRFVLREGEKSVAISSIKKLKVMGVSNEEGTTKN